ncbi:phospholipase D family protein [Microbulbifer agarilyticus]|uniref:phospholipase D family protein n=1 Tax=Microbulbifer agarilyticus TaxID=260552 RepID=UPI001CD30382|nr:phospholipase D family protein [Microbulbifer agarilyticus]MCA0901156.1 phospholipase D family protein [Microbulbifer agarilyticus]
MPSVRTLRPFFLWAVVLFCLAILWEVIMGDSQTSTEPLGEVVNSLAPATESRLARVVLRDAQGQPDTHSGFHLLQDGLSAFVARAALIEEASVSLDLQYYIYEDDTVGRILTSLLLQAADRGVRVRLLVDDLGTRVENPWIAVLDQHPNVSIRLFNPVAGRSGIGRAIEQALNFGRINHRMHNKLMVADGQLMITGGRNIGDGYFSHANVEFFDVDVLAIGAVLPEASRIFDEYWNYKVSVPVELLPLTTADNQTLDQLRQEVANFLANEAESEFTEALKSSDFARALINDQVAFHWGPASLYADPPSKALKRDEIPVEEFPGYQLEKVIRSAKQRLSISSAYFIPGDVGSELFGELERRGVQVKILTNSLSSNDVAIVHGAYARYRLTLLRSGIDLWELRTVAGQEKRQHWFHGKSRATLHAKTFVIDEDRGFVGSINLDSRSIIQNTEIGLLMENAEINQQLNNLFEEWVAPDSAWHLVLNEQGELRWQAQDVNGAFIEMNVDPETSWWQRSLSWLLSWLPIETQI